MELELVSRYIVFVSPVVSRSFGFPPRMSYTGWASIGVYKLIAFSTKMIFTTNTDTDSVDKKSICLT